jgi:DNA primase
MTGAIQAILDKADIVDYIGSHTQLTSTGSGAFRGACPIHNGTNESSLSVFKNRFRCWSCGASGNVINFVSELTGKTYYGAVEQLATELNIDLTKDPEFAKERSEVEQQTEYADRCAQRVQSCKIYLKEERKLSDETIAKYRLGFDNGAITIPLVDEHDRVISWAKRCFDLKSKYINGKNSDIYDKGLFLYGLNHAMRRMKNQLIMCEGYFDVMSADQQGLPAVAYCGIEPTRNHIMKIREIAECTKGLTVLLSIDNDGKAIAKLPKIAEKFRNLAPNVTVRVIQLPNGVKDLSNVHEAGLEIASLPNVGIDEFVLTMLLDQCSSRESEYRVGEEYCRGIKNSLIRSDLAEVLADRWGKKESFIHEILNTRESSDSLVEEFVDPEAGLRSLLNLLDKGQISTGFPSLDAAFRYTRKTEAVFIAAYASVAKTFFAGEIALYNAIAQKKNVIFFSMEMTAGSLYERLIASLFGKKTWEIEQMVRQGDPTVFKVREILGKHLYVVDTNNLSVEDVKDRVRVANARLFESPTDVIIIDYLQYMKGTGDFEGISKAAKDIKGLAKEMDVVVYCLSQLSRQGCPWIRPTMKDMKGSGDIEASADSIIGLWRPGKDPQLPLEERDRLRNQIMLGVEKHRRGCELDSIELLFDTDKTRIREMVA